MNGVVLLLYFAGFGVVLATAFILAKPGDRRLVSALVVTGLITSAAKIALFQAAPQWHDVNPDSVVYDLNARALALHWAGNDVSTEQYRLRGLQVRQLPIWTAGESIPYSGVFGTQDYLYTGYVAAWYWLSGVNQETVIFSNAVVAAFFPAAAFGIALLVGASRSAAIGAGMIAVVDPSSGINAAWLLKDTLMGFLAMTALWAAIDYAKGRGAWVLIILTAALGLLGAGRFVAFAALLVAFAMVIVFAWRQAASTRTLALIGAVVAAVALQSWIGSLPGSPSDRGVVNSVAMPIKGGVQTLGADAGSKHADSTVLRWKTALKENPVLAVIKSIAHTLFAPYPWVAIYPGLTWHFFSELYYPGVVLWIFMLPGIFRGVFYLARRRDQAGLIVLAFLGALLAAYTVFLGEWSTRERVFALPAFFALGAFGWSLLLARYRFRAP